MRMSHKMLFFQTTQNKSQDQGNSKHIVWTVSEADSVINAIFDATKNLKTR